MLADRAAEKAKKAAEASNERKGRISAIRKKDDKARGSADDKDEESDDKSIEERLDDEEDDDGESVFRKAPSLFRMSKILSVASKNEGTLLENGVQLMARALSMHRRGGGGECAASAQSEDLQDVVTTYLTTALIPGAMAAGQRIGVGTTREMRTLSEALDALIRGESARAGDILMQRFRAAEMSISDGHWTLAQHLELIPEATVSSIPMGMRGELIREQNRRDKYRDGGRGRNR